MRLESIVILWLLLSALSCHAAGSPSGLPPVSAADNSLIQRRLPGGLGQTDPNAGLYPQSTLLDFSGLLQPPAGRFGFLKAGADGHFHWADGRRARFWGICISRRSVLLPHEQIVRVADTLARAGCNAVRFEALDGPDGILSGSATDSRHLNLVFMDTLDFWLACLRARGIYYYLDLLDFRRFLPGDGLPNADALGIAGRPYAVFDPRLIALQKEYASHLLLHRNRYTGLSAVQDPALVIVELLNEHGLLKNAPRLYTLARPYNDEFRLLWNQWLLHHYPSVQALKEHWTAAEEPMKPGEDPVAGTVRFLPMPASESGWDAGGVRSARIRDQVGFLIDTQRSFFRTMRDYLRGLGLRCPITAVVSSVVAPDVWSVAQELDCTAENYYADHPEFAGQDWAGKAFYVNSNPVRSAGADGVAPALAVLRWNNRPVVIREWDTAWPNHYRATSIPDMAAYASLQDVDMALLFTYVTGPQSTHLEDFSIGSDPTVWGLYSAGASVFLQGLVRPARYNADLLYGDYDLSQWGPFLNQIHRLAWSTRIRNVTGNEIPPERSISVYSGRGGSTTMPARDWAAFQRLDAVPAGDREAAVENLVGSNHLPFKLSPIAGADFRFNGLIYDAGEKEETHTEVGFLLNSLTGSGFEPIGLEPNHQFAFGAYDSARRRLFLPQVTAREALRASLDLLHQIGAPLSHNVVEDDWWPSDTGEIFRSPGKGMITVNTARCAVISGEFPQGETTHAGSLGMATSDPDGAATLLSLDGRPLEKTDYWCFKMVTHAENTGQKLEKSPPGAPAPFVLNAAGTGPIITGGIPSERGSRLFVAGNPVAEIGMAGGTWEIIHQGIRMYLFCDTPGVRVRLYPPKKVVVLLPEGNQQPIDLGPDGGFVYPRGIIAVEAFPCDPHPGQL